MAVVFPRLPRTGSEATSLPGRATAAAIVGACLSLHAGGAAATAQRTFVASDGVDGNPCSLPAPCRSFGAAIAQTNDQGEIVVLDSAGYGKVTITKSVTIVAPPGIYAGISVFAGDDGVTVNAPSGVVVLRGLKINGQGGNNGVNFVQGAELRVEGCDIAGMSQRGINAELTPGAAIYIRDTTVGRGSTVPFGTGIWLSGPGHASLERVAVTGISGGTGIAIQDGPDAALREVVVERNGIGVFVQAGFANINLSIDASQVFANEQDGIRVVTGPTAVVRGTIADSDIVNNNQSLSAPSGGVVVLADAAGTSSAQISMTRSRSSYNHGAGLLAQNTGAIAHVDDCTVVENTGYGLAASAGGAVLSRVTNTVENNGGGALNNVSVYGGK